MKSTLILGLASAHVPYMTLEDDDVVQPQTVTSIQCQYNVGTYFFDLNPFDSIGSKENPTSVHGTGDFDFQYKVCQTTWGVDSSSPLMVTGTCDASAIAFIG